MAVSKIDWDFWLAMPYVRVWQAVALSLGINPDKMANDQSVAWEDCNPPNIGVQEEFNKRVRLLAASRSDPAYFKAGISRSTPADHDIQLIQAGKWLKSHGRKPIAAQLLAGAQGAPLKTEMQWIEAARAEGARIRQGDQRSKLSNETISTRVHDYLKRNGIGGRGGKVPSPETIRRRALKTS